MAFWRELLKVERTAVVALAAVSALSIAWGGSDTLGLSTNGIGWNKIIGIPLLFTSFVVSGIFPILVFGVPLYTFLRQRGYANWVTTLPIGLFPGMLDLFLETRPDVRALLGGTVVLLVTHFRFRKQLEGVVTEACVSHAKTRAIGVQGISDELHDSLNLSANSRPVARRVSIGFLAASGILFGMPLALMIAIGSQAAGTERQGLSILALAGSVGLLSLAAVIYALILALREFHLPGCRHPPGAAEKRPPTP